VSEVLPVVEEVTLGRKLLIFDHQENLYETAAAAVALKCFRAVAARGRFLLVVSGGQTSLPLFRLLANPPFLDDLPWSKMHVFWADERLVPPTHEASNYGQAWSNWLQHVPLSSEQLHPIDGTLRLDEASARYANRLAQFSDGRSSWPRFDLVVLGLGADGHTASLFPNLAYPLPETAAAVGVAPGFGDPPVARITLTPPVLNDARHVMFLVTGSGKADAVARTLAPHGDAAHTPARRIRPQDGQVTWFLDRDAATLVPRRGTANAASRRSS
jgi:6-phosphogluconolactonase